MPLSVKARLLLLGAVLRVIFIVYGIHHDANHALKYTDVDYYVFSDAAAFIKNPKNSSHAIGDPYDRLTYRYTPLLALLLTPNTIFPIFGKVLFSVADLLVANSLYSIMATRSSSSKTTHIAISSLWLLNPMVINISTRGSAESVLGLLVVSAFEAASRKNWNRAAIWFGLAVHFKIYPVIYAAAFWMALYDGKLVNLHQLRFGVLAFATFIGLNAGMYSIWGKPFIEHTYLYHITRLDHRHNFSPYFYPMYLLQTMSSASSLTRMLQHPLVSFIPQIASSTLLGLLFGRRDLPFAAFTQTWTFIMFNKVCTSQYFMWYLWFAPLVLPNLQISFNRSIVLVGLWVGGQALWLSQAYLLEIEGSPVFIRVWLASIAFLVINTYLLTEIVKRYRSQSKKRHKQK